MIMKKTKKSKVTKVSKTKRQARTIAKRQARTTAKRQVRAIAKRQAGTSAKRRVPSRAVSPRQRTRAASPRVTHAIPARAAKVAKMPSRPAAGLAARVLANRSASKAAKSSQQIPVAKVASPRSAIVQAPAKGKAHRAHAAHPSRPPATAYNLSRQLLRMSRSPQFTYMKAPGADSGFDVGDTVEVFCDHERESERVRGWIKGVVVQVDNKLVAVQFRTNVFLTDGWMVPDRILWYALASDQIRTAGLGKKGSRNVIPEY